MKEKKKLTYKQQQKREKAKTIIKWVFCGLGWSLLATAFVSLCVVGIRGCNNKKQPSQAVTGNITTPVKPVQPNNVVTYIDSNGNVGNEYNGHASEVCSLIGANEYGTTYANYTYSSNENDDPDFDEYGACYILCDSTLGEAVFIETDLTQHTFTFDAIRHEYHSVDVNFYLNNSIIFTIDERDWTQGDNYAWFSINMTMRSIAQVEGNDLAYVYSDSPYSGLNFGIEALLKEGNFTTKTIVVGAGNGGADSNGLYGVFSLISQAFSSMASFFSIVVIPGVNIGTLLVLPLIAIIILFIVKLFKR